MTPTWWRSRLWYVGVLVANVASLIVIAWNGWRAHLLLVVYWLETAIVTAVYAAKILRAEGGDDPEHVRSVLQFDGRPAEWYVGKENRMVADALVLTVVGPWLAWGVIIVLFGLTGPFEPASTAPVAIATVGLAAYHVVSYRFEYVGLGEYERRGPASLLVEPAPRFLALLLTAIFGMGAASATRSPVGAIVVLVVAKTCVDLVSHRRERRRAAT